MKLNKVLQEENNLLRKDLANLREEDMRWHVKWWALWTENTRLWGLVRGLACVRKGRKSGMNIHRDNDMGNCE